MNVELKQLGCVVESYKRCPPSLPSLFPLLIIIYLSISRHSHTPLPSLSPHLSHLPSWAFSSICKCLSAKWNHARGEVDEGSRKTLSPLFICPFFCALRFDFQSNCSLQCENVITTADPAESEHPNLTFWSCSSVLVPASQMPPCGGFLGTSTEMRTRGKPRTCWGGGGLVLHV